ncbi:MAG: cell division protein FtsQ/DivIB [Patescibacteria group bacterium]|nr:cell division protein FtsQ/DivIB [Patescibacteria group bacterium]
MRIISFFQKKQIPERKRARREYQEKKTVSKFLIWVIIFFVVFLISSLFYLIFFSSIFKIRYISFEVNDQPLLKIDEELLKSEINKILSKKFYFLTLDNIFFLPKKEIENLFTSDRQIEKFQIFKIFPNGMKIKIDLWQPVATFLSQGGDYLLLNKNGAIIKKINESEATLADLPMIVDLSNRPMGTLPLLSIFEFFKKTTNFDCKIRRIEIIEEKGVLSYQAITSENWKIYFEPKENLSEQINNLALILREKIDDRQKLEYIDLRFGHRIFYK